MAGKNAKEKKKRAKIKKREKELLRQKANHEAKLGNNAEPAPAEINEDAEIPMQTLEENVKELEDRKAREAMEAGEAEDDEKPDHEPVPFDTEKPFDPKSVVANILKKKME